MTRSFIAYYADDTTMGDTSPYHCGKFREWAKAQLKAEYPDHSVFVLAEPSFFTMQTNDKERREEIERFGRALWDRCPWDWPDEQDCSCGSGFPISACPNCN